MIIFIVVFCLCIWGGCVLWWFCLGRWWVVCYVWCGGLLGVVVGGVVGYVVVYVWCLVGLVDGDWVVLFFGNWVFDGWVWVCVVWYLVGCGFVGSNGYCDVVVCYVLVDVVFGWVLVVVFWYWGVFVGFGVCCWF